MTTNLTAKQGPGEPLDTFKQELGELLDSGTQAVAVYTPEEFRCDAAIRAVAKTQGRTLLTWDALNGFTLYRDPVDALNGESSEHLKAIKQLARALQEVTAPAGVLSVAGPDTLVLLRDAGSILIGAEQHTARRLLKGGCENRCFNNGTDKISRPLLFLDTVRVSHPAVDPYLARLRFARPGYQEHERVVSDVTAGAISNPSFAAARRQPSPELQHLLQLALCGLTFNEAEACLSRAVIRHAGFGPEMLATVEDLKGDTLAQSEILSYVPRSQILKPDGLGGYGQLIRFVEERALAYTPAAAELSLDLPKGIAIIGAPGTGKTKAAEIIAWLLQLPLLRFNFAAIYASLVGESEERLRHTLDAVDAFNGCVLLVDEAEKAMAGSAGGDSTGTARRAFGEFLKWLANKKDRTFVVMTFNSIDRNSPELLRKGRVDEIFYVDLPVDSERRTILEIHLRKRGIDPTQYTAKHWQALLERTTGLTGAELEEVVTSARFMAYKADRVSKAVPTAEQLLTTAEAAKKTSVHVFMAEAVNTIREFGKTRGRPVGDPEPTTTGGRKGRSLTPREPLQGPESN